jgi:hypothetical protein
MADRNNDLNARLTRELMDPSSSLVSKDLKPYSGSSLQQETYQSLQNEDLLYKQFITRTYGSYDNFLTQNKLNENVSVFDPTVDYIMDVSIVKPDTIFKTDHFSSQEVILENLSGVCSVWFNKTDGSTKRLNCTLVKKYIPSNNLNTRASFFAPMANDRIGVWDLNEQRWKSFYMSKVFKFVRDDSISIE